MSRSSTVTFGRRTEVEEYEFEGATGLNSFLGSIYEMQWKKLYKDLTR